MKLFPIRAYFISITFLALVACSNNKAHHGSATDTDASAQSDAGAQPEPDFNPTEVVKRTGTVALPAGLSVNPEGLTLQSSAGDAKLDASGHFELSMLAHGTQLVIVLSPQGNPILMGWIDSERTTINAHTTAEVLLYFTNGGPLLPPKVQLQEITAIASLDATDTVAKVITSELAANVEAFGQLDAALSAALSAPSSSTVGQVGQALIRIEPGEQSGVMLNQNEPTAFHATNSLRRRGYMFVERLTPDPMQMGEFELPPVVGLNGGVFGAASDIANAYFGNQATAYGPVDAPDEPFAIPVVNDMQTTYRVTLVGPGAHAGSEVELTEAQRLQLTEVSLRGFTKDALVPFVVNVVLGSGVVDAKAGQTTTQGKLYADLANSMVTDLLNLAPQVPGLVDQIQSGEWKDALFVLWNNAAGSNTLRTAVDQAITRSILNENPALKLEAVSSAFSKFNGAVNAAGGVFQAFDSATYAYALADSDRADQWTLDVLPSKVRLNPAESTVSQGSPVALDTVVVDADDVTGYTYHWTNSGKYGTLHEVNGAGRLSNDYCSSSPLANFEQSGDPETDGSDTIHVEVFPTSRCAGDSIGSASATINVKVNKLDSSFFVKYDEMQGFTVGPVPCAVMFLKVPKVAGATSYDVDFEGYTGADNADYNNNGDLYANQNGYTFNFLATGDPRELAYDDQCYWSHGALAGFAVSPMGDEYWVATYMSFQPINLLTGDPWTGLDLNGVVSLWHEWLQDATVTVTPRF